MATTWAKQAGRGGIPLGQGKRLYLMRADITSYTTGGEGLTPSDLGNVIRRIDQVMILNSEPSQDADHLIQWDRANAKLMAYVLNTGVQVANAVDLGTHEVWIIGR